MTVQIVPIPQNESFGVLELRDRTLRINNQVYPLANIARIQSLLWQPPKWRYAVRTLQAAAALGIVVLFFQITQPFNDWTTPMFVTLLISTAVGLLIILALPEKYVFALETNGAQLCLLYSVDPSAVDRLVDLVVRTIENPPTEPVVYSITNFTTIGGDQINQSGSGSVGKTAHT